MGLDGIPSDHDQGPGRNANKTYGGCFHLWLTRERCPAPDSQRYRPPTESPRPPLERPWQAALGAIYDVTLGPTCTLTKIATNNSHQVLFAPLAYPGSVVSPLAYPVSSLAPLAYPKSCHRWPTR